MRELRTVRLDEPFAESAERGPFASGRPTHQMLLERLNGIAKAKNVAGVFLQIGEMGAAWSRAADLRDALLEIKHAGKIVHCYFETTDNVGYFLLTSSCDRITLAPAGLLNLVGVSAEAVYAQKLLQTLGLRADLVQIGRYKGAADPLTRSDMPDEVRETLSAILDDFEAALVASISGARGLRAEHVQTLIDRGPFTAEEAQRLGLVDQVSFDDAARAGAKAAAKAERVTAEVLQPARESFGFWDLMKALMSGPEGQKPSGKRLVLAYLDGTISRGSAGSIRGSSAEAFVTAMRKFADDADVRGVVLRINSPGGSALASDLMWQAVRKVVKRKPVIVSIGDLCASGGYYVASAGTEIVAQDQSLVGSIGVVGGKLVVEDLAARFGVRIERLARGRHAGWTSASHGFSDEERDRFEHALEDGYELFVSRIAEGRSLSPQQIEPLAEGRLMSARRAREGKLIDLQGGLMTALAVARRQAGLAEDAPLQTWPERMNLFQALSELSGSGASERAILEQVGVSQRVGLVETLLAGEDAIAAVLPFALSVR